MEKPRLGHCLLPSPHFAWFCLLFLCILEKPICSQPLERHGQRLLHAVPQLPPATAMDGLEATVASKGTSGANQHQKHRHLPPDSLAMDLPLSAMTRAPQLYLHQHSHLQTLYRSSIKPKNTHIDGQHQNVHPQTFFEVSTPLDPPPRSPCASLHVFKHSFANTYTLPPAMAKYTPPSLHACKEPSHWSLIVLTWSGTSIGRQFDRIAAVWFGGVELLRTCTAEPTKRGIFWEVKKDVTKYASLLAEPQPIVVELGNLVNDIYTGVFHINLTLDFFSASHAKYRPTHDMPADLVLPVSSPSPLPSGHWFQISNDSYVPQKRFSVPTNVYKAMLEVYVSFHGDDEFWYTNPPNEYIKSNNFTGVPGNGAFREVQAYLDGQFVAGIWPFPVVYTGGIINLYWRPAAAIGAFNLPTYEFDLSPFVGALTDGKDHILGIRVENAIGTWYIDGCLHLWLDQKLEQTRGKLASYRAPPYAISLILDFKGPDGSFHTTASRSFSYSGYVVSSMGNVSVSSSYALQYNNVIVYANNTASQTANLEIHSKGKIRMEMPSKAALVQESSHSFPLDLSCLNYEGANRSSVFNCNFSHAYDEQIVTDSDSGSSLARLNNRQQAQGAIVVMNNIVLKGVAALQQQYSSEGSHGCYNRVLSTWNSTILYDSTNSSCS